MWNWMLPVVSLLEILLNTYKVIDFKEAPIDFSKYFFPSVWYDPHLAYFRWPSKVKLFWEVQKPVCTKLGSLVVIICQKTYDLETPPKVGQFKINQIQKSKHFVLFLWPLFQFSAILVIPCLIGSHLLIICSTDWRIFFRAIYWFNNDIRICICEKYYRFSQSVLIHHVMGNLYSVYLRNKNNNVIIYSFVYKFIKELCAKILCKNRIHFKNTPRRIPQLLPWQMSYSEEKHNWKL